jgi:hypothetical protein
MPITIGGGLSFCGEELSAEQFDLIRQTTRDCQGLALTELAYTVCELLEWKRSNGNPKNRECYLFLLSLQERGWLPWLPAPKPHARRPHQTRVAVESDPQAACEGVLGDWLPLHFELVETAASRQLIEQYIHRYHYLGYRVPYGGQLRYLVRAGKTPHPVLGCLLFTSAARRMAPRDRWIGWSDETRRHCLPKVVNNSRFLILPWVKIPHLASHILSQAAVKVIHDWAVRYAVKPVLLETLVDRSRYRGTCYRAANWTSVGETQGRGRMDRSGHAQGLVKEIFVYPLQRNWRDQLCDGAPGELSHESEPAGDL